MGDGQLAGPSGPRVASKPIPAVQLHHPRAFEIGQLRTRFSPVTKEDALATHLTFTLQPSDPDFPFELVGLKCTLSVPISYPSEGRPVLRVTNAEMERGYQINVERGFDTLAAEQPRRTLLSLIKELDKNLERFLMAEKHPTIKLVSNTKPEDRKHVGEPFALQQPVPVVVSMPAPQPVYADQQKRDARLKRDADIRQLEARMGRQPAFSRSTDGLSFSVPIQIPKPYRLPSSLQTVKTVTLTVPQLYHLEPCGIRLDRSGTDASLVEMAFEVHARRQPELSLMAHVNYLAQNMPLMAQPTILEENSSVPVASEIKDRPSSKPEPQPAIAQSIDDERPHVKIIPRPPEWDTKNDPEEDDSEDETSDDDDGDGDGDDEEHGGVRLPTNTANPPEIGGPSQPERGVLLSFPTLELYGIELLEISSLSLTLKCDRCKDTTDIKNIQPGHLHTETESCKKCASLLGVTYRGEPMHTNSIRAGYLDLDGCTIVDLLPSTFIPTCADCSTTATTGVISVRGESSLTICRECHHRMSFKIPDVKFLRVSNTASAHLHPLPRKKPKENLGIVSGQPLPDKGRCKHYRKSYRWFRFSCCGKVYPCDRCHDEKEDHPNEHANRMICGLCSREQNYRPEECGLCRSGLVGKKSGGFWEGGRGTRDKTKMSRKDPRKYRHRERKDAS